MTIQENSLIFGRNDNSYYLKYGSHIAGSCNGLMCLFSKFLDKPHQYYSIYLWNPSTRKISAELRSFHCRIPQEHNSSRLELFKFAFGYDDSTKTYKVVAYRVEENKDSVKPKSEVNVFNFGGNSWKNIQSFPLIPLNWLDDSNTSLNNGMHLNGTVNWLAIHEHFYSHYKYESITNVKQFVIVSLDLSTETYKQFLLLKDLTRCHAFSRFLRKLGVSSLKGIEVKFQMELEIQGRGKSFDVIRPG
ncbi:F-box protein interaction domain protein [Medicago truncatula]|uniref:F-box protein interaction domain protein n=1 Tax=Medicago truncatula TaxID=3880 RepID=A0A072U0W1_MEDTR|nr:F-box protein interaction domain protein [Medicago truncatula]